MWRAMNCAQAKAALFDDGVPANLRPFIDALLSGDGEGYSNTAPAICPEDADDRPD